MAQGPHHQPRLRLLPQADPTSPPQNAAAAAMAIDALPCLLPPPPRRRGQRPLADLPGLFSPAPPAPCLRMDAGNGSWRTHHAPAVLPPVTGRSGGERGERLPPIPGLDADAGPGRRGSRQGAAGPRLAPVSQATGGSRAPLRRVPTGPFLGAEHRVQVPPCPTEIHSRKMNVNPDVNFEELARSTDDFNGAQLKARADMLALRRDATEESYLSSPQMSVGIGGKHQASVPEWENAPSEEETDDSRAESLTRMGTVVCPLNMDIPASVEKRKTRKELVDNCDCTHPGSEDCVRVHVTKARVWIKDQLGEEAFKNCGLDAMGEQVGELWTAVEKKKLEAVCKLIRQNDQSFVEITKDLSPKQTKDLLKYCYNVFHPRSFARLTREEHKKKEAVDRDDQKSSQSDENNERRSRKKGRSSGSSSTRCRK